ncbi:methenyltetrahydrofolate synthase domain-containing protein isoform X2 [Spea bombifrons]|uniref:methenyltetrahydrofolate synthase domain-containing protein isoform X2 n=1 Tax=Spea bombifrons TaxID=233779 RepID=UPI00234BAC13|nr:methenyltetrahydrofolate synthase domain-containing protein isoform X2 [Spea bombifrons]
MEPAIRLTPGCSKWDIRQKVWDYIENNNLADFPRPVHHRIPNFKGAAKACERLSDLQAFQDAKTLKINPDTPQKNARFLTLDARKTLLVPTPRLRTGLFNKITPPAGASKEVLRICSTSQGVKEYSIPLGLDAAVRVDLVVVGSVAVSEKGWRIGKGEGFADMEYAMMVAMGAVTEHTVVVTIVHDCQVMDIPEDLLRDHDLTVDYILTPTRVIKTDCTRAKPQGIIWSEITQEMMEKIPILRKLREKERRAGKDVTLKDNGACPQALITGKEEAAHASTPAGGTDPREAPIHSRLAACDISDVVTVYIGNISPATRVSELKTILRERGASPLRLTWQGVQHRAFLDYRDISQAEKALSNLKGLNIGGNSLRVELARTRGQIPCPINRYTKTK